MALDCIALADAQAMLMRNARASITALGELAPIHLLDTQIESLGASGALSTTRP